VIGSRFGKGLNVEEVLKLYKFFTFYCDLTIFLGKLKVTAYTAFSSSNLFGFTVTFKRFFHCLCEPSLLRAGPSQNVRVDARVLNN